MPVVDNDVVVGALLVGVKIKFGEENLYKDDDDDGHDCSGDADDDDDDDDDDNLMGLKFKFSEEQLDSVTGCR